MLQTTSQRAIFVDLGGITFICHLHLFSGSHPGRGNSHPNIYLASPGCFSSTARTHIILFQNASLADWSYNIHHGKPNMTGWNKQPFEDVSPIEKMGIFHCHVNFLAGVTSPSLNRNIRKSWFVSRLLHSFFFFPQLPMCTNTFVFKKVIHITYQKISQRCVVFSLLPMDLRS